MAGKQSPTRHRVAAPAIFIIAFSVWATDIRAQDDPVVEDTDERTFEEVVVTGSRIKRRDFSSPSPIATIDFDTIAFSGQPTLEETLNQMPQVLPDYGRSNNNPGDGTSRINLRGMGAGRTLVLLNTRRLGPSGVGSAVDVNNLPQAVIERVEIITGGATTVYGSDAVAGVVNFITRDDFTGLSVDTSVNISEENDAEIYDLNLAYGHDLANGRGNITVYGGIYERKELFGSERPLGRVFLGNDDNTGTLFVSGSSAIPATSIFAPRVDYGSGPARTTFDSNGIPREFIDPDDRYNFAPINYLQNPLSRYTAGVLASFELSSRYEIYLESSFANNQNTLQLAETPAFAFAEINTDNPILTPETQQFLIDNAFPVAPGIVVVGLARRLLEVGPRIKDYDRDYWRTVLGIRGEIGNGWDIDGWITYTKSSEKELLFNGASFSRFLQGLLVDPATGQCLDPSNGCVPIDIFGEGRLSEEGAAFIRVTGVQNDTERTQTLASVVVTGTPLNTWAGPLDMAFGLEWREDDGNFKADDILFTGDSLGFIGDAPVVGTETVVEIYTEAIILLAEDAAWADYLGLELGGRYSEYDNAGGVSTYKIGGEWQPFGPLRFRGMHQRSVRAPSNLELFQELYTDTFVAVDPMGTSDPCSASQDPVGAGNSEKCILQGLDPSQLGVFQAFQVPVDFIQGGNPNLVPEVAETYTVGAVITPGTLENWTFAIDYFNLEVTDSIGPIDAFSICFDPGNTSNLFCENLTRDPDPAGAAGNVVEVFEPQSNRGLLSTEGVDTQINYATDLPNGAQLSVNLAWTHTLDYKWQQTPFSEIADCAGLFGEFCDVGVGDFIGYVIPENRVTTNINYSNGALSLHLTSRWIDGTTNAKKTGAAFFGEPEPMVAIPSVGSRHYLDLGLGYEFTESISARFGINNVTNTNPPNMADEGTTNNSDPGLFDFFGRSYYLSLSASFFQ